jgi:hypothetical protein
MNLLKTIIERLNQRVEVSNIFDQIYPLCELNANGNDKAWVHYIGNGQAEVVTNFDAKQGTLFWAKRGKVSVTKTESLKVSGCKTLYLTTFPLTAYAVVRKSHLPCDSEDSQDWIASRIYRLISGTDPDFKVSIGVIQYEVIPNGYVNEIKSLTANYEWACVAVDVDVSVVSSSEDGCYDVCATGDIPLPDFQPCTPCLTEVAVDGVTITGNGTIGDPLIAIGGGGGGGVMTAIAFSTDHLTSTGNQYVIGNVVWYLGNIYRCIANNDSLLPTNTTYWTNLGAGFETIERPVNWNATSGNNQILNKPTIPAAQVNSDWNSLSGVSEILNKPTIPILPATIVEDVTATAPLSSSGGTNPDISITQADGTTDGYLSSTDWNTFDGKFNVPTGLSTDYLDGLGTPTPFPAIPVGTVTSVNSGININVDNTNPAAPIINSLSDRYKTSSVTSNSVTNGSKSFAVDINLSYIPLQEILVVHNPANHMHGEVTSYDAATGALVVNIKTHTGSGTYTSWVLNLDGTPVDAITGSGTTNEIAYFTAARIIASLPVATYPSLTELSHVKGVTSAIQTQINAKQDALTLTTTGTSGAATLTGATLNIPQYSGGGGSALKSTTDTAGYTGNTNTAVFTQLIAANTYAIGDILRVTYRTRKTGGNGNQTLRIYVNATADLTGTPILIGGYQNAGANNFLVNQMIRHLAIKSSTNNTEVYLAAGLGVSTDYGLYNAVTTCAIDWTTNKYFVFAIQSTSLTDTNFGSMYLIEKL